MRSDSSLPTKKEPAGKPLPTGRAASKREKFFLNLFRALVIFVIAGAAVWYFASGHEFSIDAILSYTPPDMFLAALFMFMLYAVKSIAFFLPLMAIQVAVGLYFPTWAALIVNFVGIAIEINIPYFLGRKLGFDSADKLTKKFPKLGEMLEGDGSRWYIAYILRALNMLPFDLVSMYLGSLKYPYLTYFSGSMVGAAFGVLSATLIGRSLTDPTSPMFIFSCVLSCTIAGASFVMYRRINGRKRQK